MLIFCWTLDRNCLTRISLLMSLFVVCKIQWDCLRLFGQYDRETIESTYPAPIMIYRSSLTFCFDGAGDMQKAENLPSTNYSQFKVIHYIKHWATLFFMDVFSWNHSMCSGTWNKHTSTLIMFKFHLNWILTHIFWLLLYVYRVRTCLEAHKMFQLQYSNRT